MLGCHEFCGYYDWTFHYIRRRFGAEAVRAFWAEAIGGDSQRHYEEAGRRDGLAGLHRTWIRTGADEHCDWTFTLDEDRNVLRWDMRKCPSKGFLLGNDLNADEDYCDHCMGWIIPLLNRIGIEVTGHEHNHCGQCWGEMSVRGRPHQPLDSDVDIRRDPSWNRGYVDRWRDGRKVPGVDGVDGSPDAGDALAAWFAGTDHLLVLGRGPSARDAREAGFPDDAVLVTDTTYATRDAFEGDPLGVLFGDVPNYIADVAKRFRGTPPERRPLLMHTYLPARDMVDFVSHGLPRPAPILPWLIRQGFYTHEPGRPYPTTGVFLVLLATSLGKRTAAFGIDLYQHPGGKVYAHDIEPPPAFALPPRHSRECDLHYLRRALGKATAELILPRHLRL